jgi:hypothetical protein
MTLGDVYHYFLDIAVVMAAPNLAVVQAYL